MAINIGDERQQIAGSADPFWMSHADYHAALDEIEALRDRLAWAETRCVEVAETMMHASERIAEVEDWLVLWRDGGKVGPVEHEIAACKQASWYLWNSETAEEIHRIAALAAETPPAGEDAGGAT